MPGMPGVCSGKLTLVSTLSGSSQSKAPGSKVGFLALNIMCILTVVLALITV